MEKVFFLGGLQGQTNKQKQKKNGTEQEQNYPLVKKVPTTSLLRRVSRPLEGET